MSEKDQPIPMSRDDAISSAGKQRSLPDHKHEIRPKRGIRPLPNPIDITPEQERADFQRAENVQQAKRGLEKRLKEIRVELRRLNDQNDPDHGKRESLVQEKLASENELTRLQG